jgi:hypothetical protein
METKIIGRVYKLVSSHTDEVYIGSTVSTLSDRLRGHKCGYKRYTEGKHNYISAVELLKYTDVKIELIHEGEFTTVKELHKLEGSFIQSVCNCVNKHIAGRSMKEYYENNKETKKEYRENNKEAIGQYQKEYRENNKEAITQKRKEYRKHNNEKTKEYYENIKDKISQKLTCEVCGYTYTKQHKLRHEKSRLHQNAKKINQPEEEVEPVS